MGQQETIGKHKTTVSASNGWAIVVYHQTTVVKFNDSQIVLDTGGWYTPTTKSRMNQTSNQFDLGFDVYQRNFAFYVYFKGENYMFGPDNTLTLDRQGAKV